MSTNKIYKAGDPLPAPVPAGTKSGDPVRIGGLNGVAIVDRAAASTGPVNADGSLNAAYNHGGGNADGNTSADYSGAFELSVTSAAAPTYGQAIYLAAAGLTTTAGSNPLWGHSVDLAPIAGDAGKFITIVLISN